MKYRFAHAYTSDAGQWRAGDVADLDDALAAWLLRDSAGVIEPVKPVIPRTKAFADMQTYRFTADYRSGFGAWSKGETHDFDPQMAEFILNDVPGVIELVAETRSLDAPPKDRQVKRAPRARNDRGPGRPIDKATFKAVKDT